MRLARIHRVRGWLALLLLLLAAAPGRSQQAADRLRETMTAIASGETSAERRTAITDRLRAAGIDFDLQEFVDQKKRAGTNVVARVRGQGGRTLLIGAHYDRVGVGRGVVDNGGACAALVELLLSVRASPLGRHTLVVLFFDLEEGGLVGSRDYFERLAPDARPAYAINVDIFAYGDSIFATASHPAGPLLRALREAGASAGMPVRDVPVMQYPGSDHQSMIAAGLETLGLALVDGADVDGILAAGGPNSLNLGKGPRILSIIHSPRDTMDEARPDDVAKGARLLEELIRRLDRQV